MNCKLLQRIGIALAALIIVLTICMVSGTSNVHADGYTEKKYSKKVTATTVDYAVYLNMGSKAKRKHKLKVSSSKKSVAKARIESGLVILFVKKPGKATITVRNKSTNKTYKCSLKVVKYRNPFKKFTVAGKNRAGKFKKYNYTDFVNDKTQKSKISIKTKKGWKIKKIVYGRTYYDDNGGFTEHKKKIKNNSVVKVKETNNAELFQYVECILYNKKQKLTQSFTIDF